MKFKQRNRENKKKAYKLPVVVMVLIALIGWVDVTISYTADHDFTKLPMTADGWTDLLAMYQTSGQYSDSRIVYVSTSGNDSSGVDYSPGNAAIGSDPFNPSGTVAPYATLTAGYARLRDGYPDIMLLKRGDVWTTNIPTWKKSGESTITPMILGAYGSTANARPKAGQFRSGGNLSHFILSDIELDDNERSLNIEHELNHILIEGCLFPPGPGHGMTIQNLGGVGGIDYLAIRRCVIAGRYRPSGSGTYVHGFYIDDSINLLIEENVIDDNGHDEYDADNNTADIRSHNTYVMLGRTGNENHIWRYNISSRASSHGFQAGSGGTIYGNLSVQDAIALQTTREDSWYEGFSATVQHNVILHGRDINSNTRRGWGILIANANNQTIDDNIIGDNDGSGMPFGILARTAVRGGVQMQVRNVTISNNIVHNWNGSSIIDGEMLSFITGGYISNITVTGNRLHSSNSDLRVFESSDSGDIASSTNNIFYGTRTSGEWFRMGGSNYNLSGYMTIVGDNTSSSAQHTPSGDYGITDYLTSISETATLSSFYTKIRAQRKGNWDARYSAVPIINFVRDAFGREPIQQQYIQNGPAVPKNLSGVLK